jgi:nicotinamide-nucleotide amidase
VSAAELVSRLTDKGWTIATAESCTGGLVASAITAVSGASNVFHSGFVTYSNESKIVLLAVLPELLAADGAVSQNVAIAMAEGALQKTSAHVAIAVTGIAGPGGGSDIKPVGLVHFACATQARTVHLEKRFGNLSRQEVREAAVATALQLVFDML